MNLGHDETIVVISTIFKTMDLVLRPKIATENKSMSANNRDNTHQREIFRICWIFGFE